MARFLFQITAETDPGVSMMSNDQKMPNSKIYIASTTIQTKLKILDFSLNLGYFWCFSHDFFILHNFGWMVYIGMQMLKFFIFSEIIWHHWNLRICSGSLSAVFHIIELWNRYLTIPLVHWSGCIQNKYYCY